MSNTSDGNSTMSNYYNVFVYGTLKSGEPNHHWFSKGNGHYKLLCNAQTAEKFPLIIATDYNIPFLLYSPGTGNYVKGEVYEVDKNVLDKLDVLEDHPDFYQRELHKVNNLDGGGDITAWIYFIKNFKSHLLQLPMYESYSNNGDHGLRYVIRYTVGGPVNLSSVIKER
ncbi:Gamma-glutamyl cyclotransferase, AIG2-like [Popillia japonica]